MKAITLWRPWASWIALGHKSIETRLHNRLASLAGKRIAICAGRTYDQNALQIARPFLAHVPIEQRLRFAHCSGVIALATVSQHRRLTVADSQAALCLCNPSMFGLVLVDVQPITPAIHCVGHQGIWDWTPPATLDVFAHRLKSSGKHFSLTTDH